MRVDPKSESSVAGCVLREPSVARRAGWREPLSRTRAGLVEAPRGAYPGRTSTEIIRIDRLSSRSHSPVFQPNASREDVPAARPKGWKLEPVCPLDEDEPTSLGAGRGAGAGPAGTPPGDPPFAAAKSPEAEPSPAGPVRDKKAEPGEAIPTARADEGPDDGVTSPRPTSTREAEGLVFSEPVGPMSTACEGIGMGP